MNSWLSRLGLLIVSCLFSLLLLEALLRLGVIPSFVHLRNTPIGSTHPKKKILILGDSFIDRRGALNDFLDQAFKPLEIQALNTAYAGMGPKEYLAEFSVNIDRYAPDMVFLSIFVGNDFVGALPFSESSSHVWNEFKRTVRPIAKKFYLYHFYQEINFYFKSSWMLRLQSPISEINQLIGEGKMNPYLFVNAASIPNVFLENLIILPNSPKTTIMLAEFKKILDQINTECRKRNIPWMMVVFPESAQLSEQHYRFIESLGYKMDPQILSSRNPQIWLQNYCEVTKIPCHDFTQDFEKEDAESLYRPYDVHLNEQGASFAAHRILEFIKLVEAKKD